MPKHTSHQYLIPVLDRPAQIYRNGCTTAHYGGGPNSMHPLCGGGPEGLSPNTKWLKVQVTDINLFTDCVACLRILVRRRRKG